MNDRSRPYVAFLVRLWQTGTAEEWRASATDPHTGEQRLFADIQSLCIFLHGATHPGAMDGYSGQYRVELKDMEKPPCDH